MALHHHKHCPIKKRSSEVHFDLVTNLEGVPAQAVVSSKLPTTRSSPCQKLPHSTPPPPGRPTPRPAPPMPPSLCYVLPQPSITEPFIRQCHPPSSCAKLTVATPPSLSTKPSSSFQPSRAMPDLPCHHRSCWNPWPSLSSAPEGHHQSLDQIQNPPNTLCTSPQPDNCRCRPQTCVLPSASHLHHHATSSPPPLPSPRFLQQAHLKPPLPSIKTHSAPKSIPSHRLPSIIGHPNPPSSPHCHRPHCFPPLPRLPTADFTYDEHTQHPLSTNLLPHLR